MIKWARHSLKAKIYFRYIRPLETFERTYTSDFYLPEYNVYLEIKGYYSQLDVEKMECVLAQNDIKVVMVFDKHIKSLSDIKNIQELLGL